MNPLVVCFSGRIGSGKSSVSNALALRLAASSASFGAYIRSVASAKGFDSESREVLQNLGAQLIADHGHEWLCRETLRSAAWTRDRHLVVDGIRHVEVLEAIKRLVAPAQTFLIHLAIDSESELRARDLSRSMDPAERARIERHSTEIAVIDALPSIASLIVSAERPVEENVATISQFVGLGEPAV